MKKILILFGLLLITPCVNSAEIPNIQLEMRDYSEITIPQGTFIPVMNTQEISTQTCSEGYKVKFIATNDLYMHDTNIIPKDTEWAFKGNLKMLEISIPKFNPETCKYTKKNDL